MTWHRLARIDRRSTGLVRVCVCRHETDPDDHLSLHLYHATLLDDIVAAREMARAEWNFVVQAERAEWDAEGRQAERKESIEVAA